MEREKLKKEEKEEADFSREEQFARDKSKGEQKKRIELHIKRLIKKLYG